MRKEMLLVLGLMIIVVFAAGCGKNEVTDSCAAAADKDNCYLLAANQTVNIELCKNIVDKDVRTLCNVNCLWRIYTNIDCESFETETEKDDCYYFVGTYIRDEKTCDKIADITKSGMCYMVVAEESAKENICDKIDIQEQKDYCLEQFK